MTRQRLDELSCCALDNVNIVVSYSNIKIINCTDNSKPGLGNLSTKNRLRDRFSGSTLVRLLIFRQES